MHEGSQDLKGHQHSEMEIQNYNSFQGWHSDQTEQSEIQLSGIYEWPDGKWMEKTVFWGSLGQEDWSGLR